MQRLSVSYYAGIVIDNLIIPYVVLEGVLFMATIRDVARMAGVSIGTVSNILNDNAIVSEDKRKRVMDAIVKLEYRRNQAASQLRSNRSNSIGLIIPDITNPFYPEVARGVDDAARDLGWNMFLCNKDRSQKKEESAIEALLEKNVDGMLLMKPKVSAESIATIQKQCPLVLMDTDTDCFDCNIVNVDDYNGVRSAVIAAHSLGHRRIAFISGLQDSYSSGRRLNAFKDTVSELGCALNPEFIQQGDFTSESGRRLARKLLSLTERPTVIITANDMMAIGVISGAGEAGLQIPRDLSVIGYDDVQYAQCSYPQLTTVWYPKYEMGEEAVNMLVEAIHYYRESGQTTKRLLTLNTELKIRGTLAKA